MTMLRKLKRSIARYNIGQQGIDIFGKYSPKEMPVLNKRTGKFQREEVQRSFFARYWRVYCHD